MTGYANAFSESPRGNVIRSVAAGMADPEHPPMYVQIVWGTTCLCIRLLLIDLLRHPAEVVSILYSSVRHRVVACTLREITRALRHGPLFSYGGFSFLAHGLRGQLDRLSIKTTGDVFFLRLESGEGCRHLLLFFLQQE